MVSIRLSGGAHPRARARGAFVATPERAAERRAGRVLYRNTFGTQRAGGAAANRLDPSQKNVANTSLLLWGGLLLALWEGGRPTALCPSSLRTLGPHSLGGWLRAGSPFATGLPPPADAALAAMLPPPLRGAVGGHALTAHPRLCGATGRLAAFAYQLAPSPAAPGGVETRVTLFELARGSLDPRATVGTAGGDSESSESSESGRFGVAVTLPGFGFVHDFALTPRFYALVQNPVTLRAAPFAAGDAGPAACVAIDPARPAVAVLVPRPGGGAGAVLRVPLPGGACLVTHCAQSFDDSSAPGGGSVVIDVVRSPALGGGGGLFGLLNRPAGGGGGGEVGGEGGIGGAVPPCSFLAGVDLDAAPPSTLWRYVVPTVPGAGPARGWQLCPLPLEFPSVAPHRQQPRSGGAAAAAAGPRRYIYAAASAHPAGRTQPPRAWVKVDVGGCGVGGVSGVGGAGRGLSAPGAAAPPPLLFRAGPLRFAGEPLFVPRPGGDGEDDGWLVGLWFDGGEGDEGTAALAVVCARAMALVAWLPLRRAVPHGIHGCWTGELF